MNIPDSALEINDWPGEEGAKIALFAHGNWFWQKMRAGRFRVVSSRGKDETVYFEDGSEMPLLTIYNEGLSLPKIVLLRGMGSVHTTDGCEVFYLRGMPPLLFVPDEPVRTEWRKIGETQDASARKVSTIRRPPGMEIRYVESKFKRNP